MSEKDDESDLDFGIWLLRALIIGGCIIIGLIIIIILMISG